jgi:hypothetical protein
MPWLVSVSEYIPIERECSVTHASTERTRHTTAIPEVSFTQQQANTRQLNTKCNGIHPKFRVSDAPSLSNISGTVSHSQSLSLIMCLCLEFCINTWETLLVSLTNQLNSWTHGKRSFSFLCFRAQFREDIKEAKPGGDHWPAQHHPCSVNRLQVIQPLRIYVRVTNTFLLLDLNRTPGGSEPWRKNLDLSLAVKFGVLVGGGGQVLNNLLACTFTHATDGTFMWWFVYTF